METSSCIICNSTNSFNYIKIHDRLSITKDLFQLKKCDCGFIFLDPRPTLQEISQYYKISSYDPHNVNSISFWNKLFKKIQFITSLWKKNIIEKHIKRGALLDIGSGDSVFGLTMSEGGWNVTVQDKFINSLSKNIINVYDLKSLKNNNKFNVITLWHSLEHIHDIQDLFININRLISKDGVLLIAVPNFNSLDRKIYSTNWAPYDAPRHLYHFTPKHLKQLLIKNGFTIIGIKSLYQDLPYNILLSTKKNIIDIIKSLAAFTISLLLNLIFGPKQSSSFLFVCKKL